MLGKDQYKSQLELYALDIQKSFISKVSRNKCIKRHTGNYNIKRHSRRPKSMEKYYEMKKKIWYCKDFNYPNLSYIDCSSRVLCGTWEADSKIYMQEQRTRTSQTAHHKNNTNLNCIGQQCRPTVDDSLCFPIPWPVLYYQSLKFLPNSKKWASSLICIFKNEWGWSSFHVY